LALEFCSILVSFLGVSLSLKAFGVGEDLVYVRIALASRIHSSEIVTLVSGIKIRIERRNRPECVG